MAQEGRLIILAEDGRHVTVGRASEPTEAELSAAVAALVQVGLGGWLVRLTGAYHGIRRVELARVRDLAPTAATFAEATEAFRALRVASLRTTPAAFSTPANRARPVRSAMAA